MTSISHTARRDSGQASIGRSRSRRRGPVTIERHAVAICRSSGKRRYRDAHQARDALRSAQWTGAHQLAVYGETKRHETRFYRCAEGCGGFHLTSAAEVRVVPPTAEANRTALEAIAVVHSAALAAWAGWTP
ncbi:hypothetical protein [Leifsonia sp. EB34]|uniref:hypothetical protein n=1 Tax=Leifsonia sp. EB34 TaxID=3156303 RepID=UPI0035161CD1